MAYVKQTWSCGDEISAEKLNHMEEGIESANSGGGTPLIVNNSYDESTRVTTLDKTWQEIYDAVVSGKAVILTETYEDGTVAATPLKDVFTLLDQMQETPTTGYIVEFGSRYKADSADGYPNTASSN